ncbi:hypothetical protein MVEG_01564 [Podila verticillata NRRL 6337]|nr:hypothetical protein MVEG_01564 [Podila verticillata NRRL 6337]
MWQFVPDEGKDEASSKEDEERDNERGQWTGNSVFDKDFMRLMHQLKEADETRHVKRKPAFGYDEMAVFMERLQNSETIETEGIGRCLFIQAFAATAFTLWLTSDPIDPTQANIYNIYQRDNEQHVCCASALIQWIQWIELTNGHRLQADDFLFSELFDQLIQPNQPFPVTRMSNLLIKYASEAGPLAPQSHQVVGRVAKEESAEKISEYLLDDCQQETGFKDMMSPQRSRTRGRAGTTRHPEEALVLKARFGSAIRSMESRHATALGKMEKEVQDLNQENMVLRQELATYTHADLQHQNRHTNRKASRIGPTSQSQNKSQSNLASRNRGLNHNHGHGHGRNQNHSRNQNHNYRHNYRHRDSHRDSRCDNNRDTFCDSNCKK